MNKKLAVFDVDGTLIKNNIGVTYIKYLIELKEVRIIPYFITFILYSLYKIKIIDFKWAIAIGAWAIQGIKRDRLERLALSCSKELIEPLISKDGICEINKLKSEGYFIIIATGAHELIAKVFANSVGADDYIATKSIFRNQVATFKMIKPMPYKQGKSDLVLEYARQHQFEKIDRVYTDEKKDIPLLKIANLPIGVNADSEVASYVKAQNGYLLTFVLP